MSHAIETTFYNRQNAVPWHGLGEPVDGLATAADAIAAAGLDWYVEKHPVFVADDPEYKPVPGKFATIRTDRHKPLGIVGRSYAPIQNAEAFEFADLLVDSGEAKYETAGSLYGGRQVWLLAKVPEGVTVAGEDIDRYMLMTNSHDGGSACVVLFTPVRVVCANTLNLALRRARKEGAQHVSIRHSGNVRDKLGEARRVLDIGFSYFADFTAIGETMAATSMDDAAFDRFLRELTPNPPEGKNPARAERRREDIRALYRGADDLNNIRGTAWGAYNAVAAYEDHYMSVAGKHKDDGRFRRSLLVPNLKRRAESILVG